jgi:hypothetical protein
MKESQSPAAMLNEALELMTRAQILTLAAYDAMPDTMLSREAWLARIGDARHWVSCLKRFAEAREGHCLRCKAPVSAHRAEGGRVECPESACR